MRYSPLPSVTAVICPTCRFGLVAVTVTPGSTAPLSSVTTPSMIAWVFVCAVASGAINRSAARAHAADRLTTARARDHECATITSAPSPTAICRSTRGFVCRLRRVPHYARVRDGDPYTFWAGWTLRPGRETYHWRARCDRRMMRHDTAIAFRAAAAPTRWIRCTPPVRAETPHRRRTMRRRFVEALGVVAILAAVALLLKTGRTPVSA